MNGIEFYNFLRQFYNQNGQPLYGNFTFCDWLLKPDETYSFRFNIIRNKPKAIPKNVIISAWDANQIINDNWLINNFNVNFHNDCRLHMINFLINEYQNLR